MLSDLPTDRPTRFGARLLVDDRSPGFVETGFVLAAQGGRLPLQVPCNSLALCGMTHYLQAAVLDGNAPAGIAASDGLQLVIGN